jgi:lipopolysaccharide/colanic/teichoic acid biosynthesis glycosyltransferase/glycosyltransferase involved in cell wall biosynthesis
VSKYVSIVIPARNAASSIQACLKAVLAQENLEHELEVILVDDGSTDNTAKLAESLGVRVIRQVNAGPAAARNAGANQARGEIVAFTDADCVPAADWLSHLIQPLTTPDIVGAKGAYRTRQTALVARFVQQEYESKYARLAKQRFIDFVDTYSAAYRRDVFLENGGFDVAFPVPSVEDQEFSFRLARKGYHMVFVPQAAVYHKHDQTWSEYARRKFGIGYWKAFMLRWLPEKFLSDSHTPASLRWQIGLLGLAGILGISSLFWSLGDMIALGCLILFYLTGMPLLYQIYRKDRDVLWAAPVLLILRALALGSGLLGGFLHPARRRARTHEGLTLGERAIKRLIDFVGGFIGLVLSAPVLAIAAVAIKLDSRGAAFFVQERAGEFGKPFRVIKLRTMVLGADELVNEVMEKNILKGPVYKIPNDPRVTHVGRFLRRTSMDELPQFWNVLKGEMSLVGPRPEELWVVEGYNDEQRKRLAVKPGLTGPMQVAGRGELDMDARLALELDYIRNYSLWKDLRILLQTLPAVLSGKGAL